MFPKVILKRGKEQSILRRHPWIFSGAIENCETSENGAWVEVYAQNNQYLGSGFYSPGNSIAVRMFTLEKATPNADFWFNRLSQCLNLRKQCNMVNEDNSMYRLVHGEGDGMPGLIIDIFSNCAVIQAHTQGVFNSVNEIAEAIKQLFKKSINTIYCKSKSALHSQDDSADFFILGDVAETVAKENGNAFHINWITGQKTGFFLDQRPNRKLLADCIRQLHSVQNEVSVLNTFSYSGGFSVYAMAAGASEVASVDVSQNAIDLCNRNIELNFPETNIHSGIADDVLKYLEHPDKKWDIVILDPPAFAKNMAKKHKAVMGYKRLNTLGFKAVKPGGLLFTFSCSQVIDTPLFENTIVSAALNAGVNAQILYRLGQGPDHPVNIYHPEGHYLKGLVLKVNS